MADRVLVVKTLAPKSYPTDGVLLTLTAADVSNKNYFVMEGDDLLIVRNDGTGAQTVTIASVADDMGRTGDITADSLAQDTWAVYGPFRNTAGWAQTQRHMYLEASDAGMKFAVVKLS